MTPNVLRQLAAAAKRRQLADQHWLELIHQAREAGFSLREIADAAGVSHQTVNTLTQETKR